MQEEFKIYINETRIEDNKIQEGDHYLGLGDLMIKIENKNYPDLRLSNNTLVFKYYLALINARTQYMNQIIKELHFEKEILFEDYKNNGFMDVTKREEIFNFCLKEREIIESMIQLCELAYNNANKIIYQKYIDDNKPKFMFDNTDEEEEA